MVDSSKSHASVGRHASGMVPLAVKKTIRRFWVPASTHDRRGLSMAERKGPTVTPPMPRRTARRERAGHQGLPMAKRKAGERTVASTRERMSRSSAANVAAASSISQASPDAPRQPWAKRNHCRAKHWWTMVLRVGAARSAAPSMKPLTSVPASSVEASTGRPFSWERQRPMPSKCSNARPGGSMSCDSQRRSDLLGAARAAPAWWLRGRAAAPESPARRRVHR